MKHFAIITLSLALLLAGGCSSLKQASVEPYDDEAVEIGYGKVPKSKLTNSVSKVNIKEDEVSSYSTIYDYLRGRVAGLYVGPSSVGGTPEMRIRGTNSINMSNQPLIIVDGVEMTNISWINPRDVRNVEVLKDAGSSIYGVRGANGVIIITTRQ